jgi:transcription antitermination factor NusB
MRKRTLSREITLKILYIKEIRDNPLDELLDEYFEEHEVIPEIRQFSELLIRGTVGNLEEIDGTITKYADNWDLNRMATVDRNVLRFATFELLYLPDIPPKVAINEAVNIAKKYSQENSGKFVNGILDKISHTEKRRTLRTDLNCSE